MFLNISTYPNTEFLWSVFSSIWTEYGYLVRMLENTDQKNCVFEYFSRSFEVASRLFLLEWSGVELIDEATKQCMFGVTRRSLLKSTNPKLFFVRICKNLCLSLGTTTFCIFLWKCTIFIKKILNKLLYHLMRSR